MVKKRGLINSRTINSTVGHGYEYLRYIPLPLFSNSSLKLANVVGGDGSHARWRTVKLCCLRYYLLVITLTLTILAFAPAVLVTPLGALSVVVSAFLSAIFLNERLNFAGKIGCAQCVVGAVIIVLHTPETTPTSTIPGFLKLVLKPGFLTFSALALVAVGILIFYAGPRHGQTLPLVYITICALLGALVVVATQGLGAAIVHSTTNPTDNQLLFWEFWLVFAFVGLGGVIQINFLNKALNTFSTAIVSPVFYVMFTVWRPQISRIICVYI